MSALVIVFFAFVTLAVLVSGYLLPRYLPTDSGRRFGYGLLFVGLAFAIWTVAVWIKPDSNALYMWVTVGLVVLLAALLLLISAAASHLSAQAQQFALAIGAGAAVVLLVVRFFYPSNPSFSPNGLFYFNQQPAVAFFTIALLAATIVPAVLVVGRDLRERDAMSSNVFLTACFTELVGGTLLLGTQNDDLLFLVGWAMGIGFLLLVLVGTGVFARIPSRAVHAPTGK